MNVFVDTGAEARVTVNVAVAAGESVAREESNTLDVFSNGPYSSARTSTWTVQDPAAPTVPPV